jgi:hypothetical protein
MTIRYLVLSLVGVVLFSGPEPASAQTPAVALSLNLRYKDPADPLEGGRWFLVAKTAPGEGNFGLAALSTYITNISTVDAVFGNAGVAGFQYPAVTGATLGANVDTPDGGPFAGTLGAFAHIVYGQDNSVGAPAPLVIGVGQGPGTPGSVPTDPLANFPIWNDAALIASGTFPASQSPLPAFAPPDVQVTTASVLTSAELGSPLAAASVTTTRRGDSVGTLALNTPMLSGLPRGDVNRDFRINSDDLNLILLNFNKSGKSWDEGDVTDGLGGHVEGTVNADDLGQVLLRFNNTYLTPAPATLAIPEPSTAAIACVACLAMSRILGNRAR